MNRLLLYSVLSSLVLLAPPALADPKSFTPEDVAQLQEVIDSAVAKAMNDPSVGDGNPQTRPPATVILSTQAPNLTEGQRVDLAQMIDSAVQRALSGQTMLADAAKPQQGTAPAVGGDPRDPNLHLTDLTKERLTEPVARELGFDVDANRRAVESEAGYVESALTLTDIGLNSAASAPNTSSVQILAGSEGARASLKLDQSSGTGDPLGNTRYWSRSLVFSAPIDKSNPDNTDLIGLDGLTNGFEVAYNATRIRTEGLGRPGKGEPSLLFRMPIDCKKLGIPIPECDYSTLMRVAAKLSADTGDKRSVDAQGIAKRYALTGRAFVQGFRLKAGHDDMVFYDPATLAKRSQDEIPWSTGVFIGRLTGSSYYTAGLDYQQSYKSAASGTFCPAPDPISGISRCVAGPLGAPSSDKRHLVNLEARWMLGERAIGLKVVRDFKNHHWGVDMPIYLFPNDKGLLTGGLRLGWTDVDQFSAGVFVGVPFKMFD